MTSNPNTNAVPSDRDVGGGAFNWEAGRRAFLRTAGLGAVGMALLGGAVATSNDAEAQALTDVDILNFALNLEYLEAEFYLRAVGGVAQGLQGPDISGRGKLGQVIHPATDRVTFATANFRLYAFEIAQDERAHVRLLRGALGDAKVARPTIDLRNSFTAAARAAGLVPANGTFDPFANELNFLLASYIFEDVGVTAYKGAARFIQNKDTLEAAAGLLAVEAYHAGIIRTILFSLGQFQAALAISDLRDGADGPGRRDQGIGNTPKANLTPTDGNGLAYSRSVAQVTSIVVLGSPGGKGGFLPDGFNV